MPEYGEWEQEDTVRFLEALGLPAAAAAARPGSDPRTPRGFLPCIVLAEAVRELLAADESERRHARRRFVGLLVPEGEDVAKKDVAVGPPR